MNKWLQKALFFAAVLISLQAQAAVQLCRQDAPRLSDKNLKFTLDGPRDSVNTTFENAYFAFPKVPSIFYLGENRCGRGFATGYMNGQLNIGSLKTNGDYIDTGKGFGVKIEFTDPNNGNNWTKLVQNGSARSFQTYPFQGTRNTVSHQGLTYGWMSDLGLSLRITGLVKYGGSELGNPKPGETITIELRGAYFEVRALNKPWIWSSYETVYDTEPVVIELKIQVGALKTCKINNNQMNIDLKAVSKSDLERQQVITGEYTRNDAVELTCEQGISVRAVLTDLKEPIEKDYLNTYVQTSQGEQDSGVAFKIRKAEETRYLKLGPATSDALMFDEGRNYQFKFGSGKVTTSKNEQVRQRFFVDYAKKPGAKIIPGNIKGMAQITFSYQ